MTDTAIPESSPLPPSAAVHLGNTIRSHVTRAYLAALVVSALLSTLSTIVLISLTDLQQSKRIEVYALAATIITMGLEAGLIFAPLSRRIEQHYALLLAQIAEQARIQAELKRSETRYRLLIRSMPDFAILMFDRELRYTLAEGQFLERGGYPKEKVEGKLPEDVMPSASVEALTPLYRQALDGITTVIEREVDGVIHFTRILPVKDEHDAVIGGMILSEDVTRQRKIEARLRESEEQYRSLFDNSLDAVLLTDTSGKIYRANSAACQMLGYSEEEITQLGRGGVMDTSDPRLENALEERAQTGHFRGELSMIRKDGIDFPVELSTQVFASVGDAHKTSMIVRDITQRKQAERRSLELALEKEKIQILSKFVTSTSHDLRTPLSIITTSTYLCRKATTPVQQQARLDIIDDQVQHLNRIIDQLHRMASLDQTLELKLAATDINTVVDRLMAYLRPQCAEKGIALTPHPAPALPPAQIDAIYIMEALKLIAENAVRYTPTGGDIAVTTFQDGLSIGIKIADTGIGIAPEHLSYIFERFYKIDEARSDSTAGAGLGLPMAKRIVNAHHGSIHVESQPGSGTTVLVTLPIQP